MRPLCSLCLGGGQTLMRLCNHRDTENTEDAQRLRYSLAELLAKQMTINPIETSQRKAARVAGLAGLITMALVVVANFGINGRLLVPGNAAQTAANIIAHQTLFRVGIACFLTYSAGIFILLSALYTILKPVNRTLALPATFFRLVYALAWVVVAINLFGALRLLTAADYLRVLDVERLHALARLSISANADVYYVGLLFYALASTLCSYLWLKSHYIPRTLAALGLVSSLWCVAATLTFLISPNFAQTVNLWWFDSPMGLFEMALSFWLLLRGLDARRR